MMRFLLLFLFFSITRPLSAEIYEVRLVIDGLECPYCGKVVEKHLGAIKGAKSAQAWFLAGLATLQWTQDTPFHTAYVNKALTKCCYTIREIHIDLEGTIEERKNAVICKSLPDGSIFYLENRSSPLVKNLKDGQVVRLQGAVKSDQGFNFLCVKDVLSEVK